MVKQITTSILFILASFGANTALADALSGNKLIFLMDNKGNEVRAGSIHFTPQQGQVHYQLHMEHERFKDFFLSMKEMKCLEGPELMCHLPYPYPQPHTVSADDLSWLAHDLLFMYKKPTEFGANFWNGIYFDMRVENDEIRGEAQAVDLNLLASPPEDLTVPPIHETERDDIDTSLRWLPRIVIR